MPAALRRRKLQAAATGHENAWGSPVSEPDTEAMTLHPDDEFAITLGIEEEFFLVDPRTRDLIVDPDVGIFEASEKASGAHKIVREFLRAQIESNTRVCNSVALLRQALRETRGTIIDAAERHGAALLAASTHPFASQTEQMTTPRKRYETFASRFQENVRQFLIGGMHIHAGFGDADSRIRIMTVLRNYLPLLHALSTSSPFSQGRMTGFKSWRLTLMGGLPRTGIPGPLHSWDEYDDLLGEYQRMKFIEDGSELWWDIRPSHAFPTIELRICDVCTRIEDAVCISALYASLIRMLMRLDKEGKLPLEDHTEIISENRWVAQRYGVLANFGDSRRLSGRTDIEDLVTELLDDVAEDAQALRCEVEIRRALDIVREGTSADRQVDLFRLRRVEGDSDAEALHKVVDQGIADTREGI